MSRAGERRRTMRQVQSGARGARSFYWVATALVVVTVSILAPQVSWAQSNLENPAQGSFQSGLGFIVGWKCQASNVTASIDGGAQVPIAYGLPRGDTQAV